MEILLTSRDDPTLHRIFDFEDLTILSESPASQVARTRYRTEGGPVGNVVAIKSAYNLPGVSHEPHDIERELRILYATNHTSVIDVLGHSISDSSGSVHYWMPCIDFKLVDLLNLRTFSPYIVTPGDTSAGATLSPTAQTFEVIARSLLFQITAAIAYLHEPKRGVAHRDVKPGNILITETGCVKLIDFGVSWHADISSRPECLWPEPQGNLCFDVSTGPYRAPELLFGARNYDPFATDLWSLGTLFAEFFRPLELDNDHDDDFDDESDDEGGEKVQENRPFIFPGGYATANRPHASWFRKPLFDASRGSIGLAWSIFKIRGTPTPDNWPAFTSLPDGNKVSFIDASPVDLKNLLPNLSPSEHPRFAGSHFPPAEVSISPLDIIYRLLVYPPERRLKAADTLQHPWFTHGPLVLPTGYPGNCDTVAKRDDRGIGDALYPMLEMLRMYDTSEQYESLGEEEEVPI